jgi:hypothetical protein
MRMRLRLAGGTLKLKTRRHLRRSEMRREVPVWKIGFIYLIWWSDHPASDAERGAAPYV